MQNFANLQQHCKHLPFYFYLLKSYEGETSPVSPPKILTTDFCCRI